MSEQLQPLTKKQKAVLEFIKAHVQQKRYPPAIRDIAEGMGYSSVSTVFDLVDKLVRKGYIEKGTGPREITILHTESLDPQPGLYAKYTVINKENGKLVDNCFVLRPDRDPAARSALMQYALACDNEELALDIQRWIAHLAESEEVK